MQTKGSGTDHRAFRPTKDPGIYKRGNRYAVRFRDAQGAQRYKSARTLAEARTLKAEVTADVSRGEYRPNTKMTFAQYAEQWKEHYGGRTKRGLRSETLTEYQRDIDRAVAFFGATRLSAIDPPAIKRYARSLSDAGLQQGTVRRILAPLKACLATAVDDGYLRSNPTAGIRIVTPPPPEDSDDDKADTQLDDDGHAKALTPDQLADLVENLGDGWHSLIVRLMAQSGLRISEALGLRWADVDTRAGCIQVRQRVRRGKVGKPKSSNGVRQVPVGTALARDLVAHRLASPYSADSDLVFPTRTGKPCLASNLYRWYKPAAEKAGAKWAGFHTLRHTAATRWLVAGVGIAQVSKMLGHHDPGFTLARYVHVMPHDLPAGDTLAAAVGMA